MKGIQAIRTQISHISKSSTARGLRFAHWFFVGALFFAIAHSAHAQQTKLPTVGWLSATGGPNAGQATIVRLLRNLGHIEGKNIAFEFRYANSRLDRLPTLAEELVRLKVDVLLTPGTPSALALKNATKTIPIVFADVTDPVGAGLVESLAHPGGNITGFSSIEAVLAGKRLELLKDTIAGHGRVAVLWNPHDPSCAQQWQESQLAARQVGLQLHSMKVTGPDKFEAAFKDAVQVHASALFVVASALAASNHKQIVQLANKYRLPAIYTQASFVTEGGLISYGPNQSERYQRIAVLIDKILKGAKPADLPVEQPTKFELIINLKTAKQLGVTIPPGVLTRADRVIK